MSSNPSLDRIDPPNLTLIRSILRGAGLRGSTAIADPAEKRAALIFLEVEFRKGARSREALLRSLNGQGEPSLKESHRSPLTLDTVERLAHKKGK